MEPASPNSCMQIEDDVKKSQMAKARIEQPVKETKSATSKSQAFTIKPCTAKPPKKKIVLARPVSELDDELDDEEEFETDVHLIDDMKKADLKAIAKKCRNLVKKAKNLNTTLSSCDRLALILQDIEAIKNDDFDLVDSDFEEDHNIDDENEDNSTIVNVHAP